MTSFSAPAAVLLYDAACGFCRRSVARILGWDRQGRLRPVVLQDPEADELLPGMDLEQRMASWHLVAPDGTVYSGGAVVPPLMRLLPGGRPIAALAAAFPGTTERVYRWVARNRGPVGPRRR
jgi:predicted DCC family thiol-disulfide oxidoreductase YuxK